MTAITEPIRNVSLVWKVSLENVVRVVLTRWPVVRGPSDGPTVESVFLLSEVSDIGLKSKGAHHRSSAQAPPPIFFMVHLLHRLYGVDAPELKKMSMRSLTCQTECNLSAFTATNTSRSFTYKKAAIINWHRYGTIITPLSPYVYDHLCQKVLFCYLR